ncbi:uncharacterized protein LOC103383696 [Cynoglossus semilaevis]|uniref:Ciliary neurotrophic factor n=1 Tax=Cynoglossus semilaevis TaxID=244447 RepID=A0A3P8UV02_CYNSE|nr:uncharacterized protein LOC103383696 [Cynoglossus semilaevis]
MAHRRSRHISVTEPSRTTMTRTTAIAEQLHYECCVLLELYKKKESFTTDVLVADGRLVTVPPPSSQLDTTDKLWRLHSALLQCSSLLEIAIIKEEEELGGGKTGDYESQRKTVKERLSFLLVSMGELRKAVDGSVSLTPTLEGLKLDGPTALFELKLWIYRIFEELDYWTKMVISTLQGLSSVLAKERARTTRMRSTRNARR